jgi:predicted TIM-barrel fold metal-dependent hydrolase
MIDVNAFIGPYPFRYLPHPDPAVLVRVLAREGTAGAWVGHLPTVWYRDPTHGNEQLLAALEPHRATLHPAPAVRPDWPGWERALAALVDRGARAIRAYPAHWQLGPGDARLARLVHACGEAGVPLVLTTRFEDLRQRHPLDVAGDLSAAALRAVARASTRTAIVVTGAGRETIEEVHWALTPDEQARVWYDISWVWGPPEDHLAHLVRTVGAHRLLFGTSWPLRLTQLAKANLELLPPPLRAGPLADASAIARLAAGGGP